MKKLVVLYAVVGLAVAVIALTAAQRADPKPSKRPLTGRTGQGKPFVTQLTDGRLTWFDTGVELSCGDAFWNWDWRANRLGSEVSWDGSRLTASTVPAWEGGYEGELALRARYTAEGGLEGEMRFAVDGCDTGWLPFWARSER